MSKMVKTPKLTNKQSKSQQLFICERSLEIKCKSVQHCRLYLHRKPLTIVDDNHRVKHHRKPSANNHSKIVSVDRYINLYVVASLS